MLPIAHHQILKDWDYKNNKSSPEIKINLYHFESREYLKDFFKERDIKYENKIDRNYKKN